MNQAKKWNKYLLGFEYFVWCWFVKTYSSVSYSDETSIAGGFNSLFLSAVTTNTVIAGTILFYAKFKHEIIEKKANSNTWGKKNFSNLDFGKPTK